MPQLLLSWGAPLVEAALPTTYMEEVQEYVHCKVLATKQSRTQLAQLRISWLWAQSKCALKDQSFNPALRSKGGRYCKAKLGESQSL